MQDLDRAQKMVVVDEVGYVPDEPDEARRQAANDELWRQEAMLHEQLPGETERQTRRRIERREAHLEAMADAPLPTRPSARDILPRHR